MDLMISEGLFSSNVLTVGSTEGGGGMEPRVCPQQLVRPCGSAGSCGSGWVEGVGRGGSLFLGWQ